MKILYGIQGTGHGHISRAREILPLLAEKADVDVLVSGYICKLTIDDADVIQKRGISLTYDSGGGVSYLKTAMNLQPIRFLKDVHGLNLDKYDMIISDYEPVTAWACATTKRECTGLSHQAAFLSKNCPRPDQKSVFAEGVLKHFAPCSCPVGFHFLRYDSFINPPIIRRQVRNLLPVSGNHITVYLPAFDHETLVSALSSCKLVDWHLFSPQCDETYQKHNVKVHPVGNETFLESMESSLGVLTSAGFETCAETMYLGKKLMVMPIRNQYEQLCNAAALETMGIPVAYQLGEEFNLMLKRWILEDKHTILPEIADVEKLTAWLLKKENNRSGAENTEVNIQNRDFKKSREIYAEESQPC